MGKVFKESLTNSVGSFMEILPEPTWKDRLARGFYTCVFNIAYYPLRWAYIAWDAIDDAFYVAWERENE